MLQGSTCSHSFVARVAFVDSKNIKFGILPSHQISQVSEVEVVNRELYSIVDRQPIKHGVLDRRLVGETLA